MVVLIELKEVGNQNNSHFECHAKVKFILDQSLDLLSIAVEGLPNVVHPRAMTFSERFHHTMEDALMRLEFEVVPMTGIMLSQNSKVLKDQSAKLTVIAHGITLMQPHNMPISAGLAGKGMVTIVAGKRVSHFVL